MERIVVIPDPLPQGTLGQVNNFCWKTLCNEGILKELDAVTGETIIALGKPKCLLNKIFVFRILQKLIKGKELPEIPRQGLKGPGKERGDDDWIILHRYAQKNEHNKNGLLKKQEVPRNNPEVNDPNNNSNNNNNQTFTNNNIPGDDYQSNQPDSEAIDAMPNYQDYSQYFYDEHESVANNTNNNNGDIYIGTSNQSTQQYEVTQSLQIITEALQNQRAYNESNIESDEVMEDVDGLPDVPSSWYFKLLRESIAKKRFFNKPITIYEELFKFKLASDDMMEEDDDDDNNNALHGGLDEDPDEEVEEDVYYFWNLTQEDFKFIVDNKLLHLTSPAGTGKTMTMWQLAKSVNVDFREKLVPIAIKAEHYYHQIMLADQFNFQHLSIEALVRGSMHTAEVRNIEDQKTWCQNLEATIRNGTGVVLLIDALDEMKSRDREEFLKHIRFLTANIPGVINGEVNLKAIVVSSRPGLTLPTDSEDLPWLQLELCEQDDSKYVLQTLCEPESSAYMRALELCEHYEFPKYLFWYSLLVIEAEAMDENSPLTASQFDFLGGLLLRSIRTTKDKKTSLDADQSAILNEDPTYLLLLAGLIAYISKVQQTRAIADLERELMSLMTDMSFPKSIIDSRGSVIKKLLPVLQFCHCCTSCTEDSEDKMIVFDHQIVFDYLVASFIIKTILQQSYPSLSKQINDNPSLAFDWQHYVKDTARYDPEWIQVMHLIADALPVGDFITTIKKCSIEEAEDWLTSIANHPRCYDIEDPTFAYVKLAVSCVFNASRKSVNAAKTRHINKFKRSKEAVSYADDRVTRLSFELLLNLFSQPLIGQLIIDEICLIKSFSLLFTELTQRNLHDRFVQIFIEKFNATSTSDQRVPEELVRLAIRFFIFCNPEINSRIQDALFNRLSLRCDTEPTSSPLTIAIHNYFRKIRAFDYLLDKLTSDNELDVASALPILLSFKTYWTMRLAEMYDILRDIAQRQSLAPNEDIKPSRNPSLFPALLASGSLTWLEIKHACRYFDNVQFIWLREGIREHNRSIKNKSLQTREVIQTVVYYNFYSRKKSETFLAGVFKGKPTSKGFVHEATQEDTEIFAAWIQLAAAMLEAREEYKPLAALKLVDDEWAAVIFVENTVEEALAMLAYNAEKKNLPIERAIVKKNIIINRCHLVQLVADNVLAQLFNLIDQLTNEHIALLIEHAHHCFCSTGPKNESYPVVNYNHLEKLLVALCSEDRAFRWSPETVVKLWEFLGTECYQFYLEEFYHDQVFPDLIEKMTDKWSTEEACAFLAAVMEMDLKSKLQYDVMQMIALLTVEA